MVVVIVCVIVLNVVAPFLNRQKRRASNHSQLWYQPLPIKIQILDRGKKFGAVNLIDTQR
jgi:hypothetical protein